MCKLNQLSIYSWVTYIFALMKTSNLILLGVGGYIAIRLLGLNKLSNQMTFTPASVGAKRDGKKLTISFGLDINNPTPVQAKVNRTYGNIVDNNNNPFGSFTTGEYVVAPSGVTRINIPIVINLGGSLFALFNSIINKNTKLTINYTNEVGLITTSDKYDIDIASLIRNPLKKDTKTTKDVAPNPLV
jgi:hypothetical protein